VLEAFLRKTKFDVANPSTFESPATSKTKIKKQQDNMEDEEQQGNKKNSKRK